MATFPRFPHFRFQEFKDFDGSDARQIPAASATIDVYKQGAHVEIGSGSIAPAASGSFIARDLGRIRVGDTLFRLAPSIDVSGTSILVDSITIATRTVDFTNNGGAAITVSAADRWTSKSAGTKPVIYSEPSGQSTPVPFSKLTTDSRGFAECWTDEEAVDYVVSGTGLTTRGVADHGGEGGSKESSNVFVEAAGTPAHISDTKDAISNDQPIHRFSNNGVEKVDIHGDGSITAQGLITGASGLTISAGTVSLPAGEIGTSEIANDAITVALLAAKAATFAGVGTANTDYTITASFADVPGATVTITPQHANSAVVIIGIVPFESGTAAACRASFRIRKDAATVISEGAGTTTAATGDGNTIPLIALDLPGDVSAHTYNIQAIDSAGDPRINSSTTDRKARIIAVELVKQS